MGLSMRARIKPEPYLGINYGKNPENYRHFYDVMVDTSSQGSLKDHDRMSLGLSGWGMYGTHNIANVCVSLESWCSKAREHNKQHAFTLCSFLRSLRFDHSLKSFVHGWGFVPHQGHIHARILVSSQVGLGVNWMVGQRQSWGLSWGLSAWGCGSSLWHGFSGMLIGLMSFRVFARIMLSNKTQWWSMTWFPSMLLPE